MEVVREGQSVKEQKVEADEEQDFLQKLSSVEVPLPKRTSMQKTVTDVPDGNSPLLSFFNNLLKQKDQTSPRSPISDPQAQLQRMLEQASMSPSAPHNQS
ncbi:unnamed protein product [Enterobius vermicularis]|uniref:Dynein light intermediate chain n=1 Tax=Enterobius vermicularis TaxID=51028 RepID=A0A3P6IVS0_ENTVE|nr:unnamed protein product [Enterobius vermicularis]